jgi:hypothetical protein
MLGPNSVQRRLPKPARSFRSEVHNDFEPTTMTAVFHDPPWMHGRERAMSRATPFTKTDVEERNASAQVDPELLERVCADAPVLDVQREHLKLEVRDAIWQHRLRTIQHKQELSARKVAALTRVLACSERLLQLLESLPQSLRMDLRNADIEPFLSDFSVLLEQLIERARLRSDYWHSHVEQNRPYGERSIGEWLRQDLMAIIGAVSNAPERRRRQWVARVCKAIGAKYPNEKKNKKRFLGQQVAKDKPSRKTRAKRDTPESKEARSWARKLRGVNI